MVPVLWQEWETGERGNGETRGPEHCWQVHIYLKNWKASESLKHTLLSLADISPGFAQWKPN